jgi:RND family efflux transporter MFP subunit
MRRSLLLAACACALLAACSKPAEDATPDPVALVRTAAVSIVGLDDAVEAYGRSEFDPADLASVTAPVEARVSALPVAVGQSVQAGTTVALLSASPAARMDADKAARDAKAAQADYERLSRLRADGLAANNEVDAARAAAGSAMETSRSLNARTGSGAIVLRAGRAGVIDALPVAVGDLVAMGGPVVRVGGLSQLRARLGVEPNDAQRMAPGQTVRLSPVSGTGSFLGHIQSVDKRVDPTTRLAGVLVLLPGGGGFMPGETIKGKVVVGHHASAPSVPRAALLYEGDAPYVFVAAGGKAVKRPVRLGIDAGEVVEITDGVRPGERVVTEGGAALDDGMKLREAPPAAADAKD